MIRRLLASLFGPLPEPESVALLRQAGAQLTDAAGELRVTAARARLLDAQVQSLDIEVAGWRRRLDRLRGCGVVDLVEEAARMLGRVEGQRDAARAERDKLLGEEISKRRSLADQRQTWLTMVAEGQRMGHDMSTVVTHIDLTAPPPAEDDGLPEDEEREFLARAIDGMALH